jgi:hypothetical protein
LGAEPIGQNIVVKVDVCGTLPAGSEDDAWRFYRTAFDHLRYRAIERHLLDRDEFDELMADTRIVKYLAWQDDTIVGLAAQTRDLRALPYLSPDFFRHRWPDMYAQRRIFYAVFVGAQRDMRGAGVFVALLGAMMRPIRATDGMVMVDICTHNEAELDLPSGIARVLRRIAGTVRPTRVDSQSYWLYEFPDAS